MRELLLAVLLAGEVLFPQLVEGQRLGSLRVEPGTMDARGRPIEPGTYALHYARQPPLKDHLDTAENPDFALLVDPGASRADMKVSEVVAAAKRVSGDHPWVLALAPPGTSGTCTVGPVGVRVARAGASSAPSQNRKDSSVCR
jgi:hypothetical protein